MKPEVWTAMIVAVPPTLVATTGMILAIKSHTKTTKSLDHITVLTNSRLTEATQKIDELEKVVRQLVANPGSTPTDQTK